LCDDNSVEKLKKQPNFYANGSEIRSAFFTIKPMILLVYKEAYFNTNDLHSAIPSVAVSLMQEFDDVFPEDIPNGLPPLRGIECHNPFLGHSQIFFSSSKLHFFSLKKKPKQCRFERHCSPSSLPMQRQGGRRFLKSFSRSPSPSLFPPTCLQKLDTSHIPYPATINASHDRPPYPVPRHGQDSHLTRRHGSGKVPLSSCGYKYREGRRQKRGEKKEKRKPGGTIFFFEKERNEPGGQNFGEEQKTEEGEQKTGGRVYLRGEELGQNRRKRKKRGK